MVCRPLVMRPVPRCAQFRFLAPLLLTHGRWSYKRISLVIMCASRRASLFRRTNMSALPLLHVHSAAPPTTSASLQSVRNRSSRQSFAGRYFFYKNVVYTFTLFWFNLLAGFSGQRMYDDWYHSMYSLIFTSMPVIAVGLLDQDVSKARPAGPSDDLMCATAWTVYHRPLSFPATA